MMRVLGLFEGGLCSRIITKWHFPFMPPTNGSGCISQDLRLMNWILAGVDGAVGLVAAIQLIRIHATSTNSKWTRQKVFHFMVCASNLIYCIFFVINPIASCANWECWFHACGFIALAIPQIIFLATFLLLLSFWIDLCHQATDRVDESEDDDDDDSASQSSGEDTDEEAHAHAPLPTSHSLPLNPPSLPTLGVHVANGSINELAATPSLLTPVSSPLSSSSASSLRQGLLLSSRKNSKSQFRWKKLKVKGRQRIVVAVIAVITALTAVFAFLIWYGFGDNPIDPVIMAQMHSDFFAVATLLSGGGLAFYGLMLYFKMSRVRSGRRPADLQKVAWLALICLVCFSLRAFLVLAKYLPAWVVTDFRDRDGNLLPLWYFAYYFVGETIPCAVVLFILKDVPSRSHGSSFRGFSSFPSRDENSSSSSSGIPHWLAQQQAAAAAAYSPGSVSGSPQRSPPQRNLQPLAAVVAAAGGSGRGPQGSSKRNKPRKPSRMRSTGGGPTAT